jgi:hypothetical protein
MQTQNWCIIKWCKAITDSGVDETVMEKPENMPYKFRLKDDDNEIYAYGYSKTDDDEAAFEPLDWAEGNYGCTMIEYKNKNGEWEML